MTIECTRTFSWCCSASRLEAIARFEAIATRLEAFAMHFVNITPREFTVSRQDVLRSSP